LQLPLRHFDGAFRILSSGASALADFVLVDMFANYCAAVSPTEPNPPTVSDRLAASRNGAFLGVFSSDWVVVVSIEGVADQALRRKKPFIVLIRLHNERQ
jgi:hypothetical protein